MTLQKHLLEPLHAYTHYTAAIYHIVPNKRFLNVDRHQVQRNIIKVFSHFCQIFAYFVGNIPSQIKCWTFLFKQERLLSTIQQVYFILFILFYLSFTSQMQKTEKHREIAVNEGVPLTSVLETWNLACLIAEMVLNLRSFCEDV